MSSMQMLRQWTKGDRVSFLDEYTHTCRSVRTGEVVAPRVQGDGAVAAVREDAWGSTCIVPVVQLHPEGTPLEAMLATLPVDARTARTDVLMRYLDERMRAARDTVSVHARDILCADARASERHVLLTILDVPHLSEMYDVRRLAERLEQRLRELTR